MYTYTCMCMPVGAYVHTCIYVYISMYYAYMFINGHEFVVSTPWAPLYFSYSEPGSCLHFFQDTDP